MKIVTYASTPGLDRFPESERFRVYRSAYKGLMAEDSAFRGRVNRFKVSVAVATALLVMIDSPAFIIGFGGWLAVTALVLLNLGYVAYVLHAAFHAQSLQNEKIGRFLEGQAA
jgi:hypothetical protein